MTWMDRMICALIAGTVLATLVAAPICATRQNDYYGARASYAGLIFGGRILVWDFDSGISLLFVRERQRRLKRMFSV
jgi:hypothetical protein